MRVVSNTSPLSNLAIIGRLELLQRRYGQILIPAEVASELAVLSHPTGASLLRSSLAQGWLRVEQPANRPQIPFSLDPGETAAIALALAVRADVLLMDEKRGRAAARASGLTVAGLLGELIHAKYQGWIPNLREEIAQLRTQAGFFIGAEIETFILSQAGE